jgi:iron uptake system EfeUOB component EfeO/EfeM
MLSGRRRRLAVAPTGALAVAALLAGCGGSGRHETAPARPYTSRDPAVTEVRRATPADYRAPIAAYRRHVRRELGAMLGDVAALRGALARGDLGGARAAWVAASARYETIGAAYGAFGDLDAAVNGRPDGLPGGVRSPDFTGLHRVELALWGRSSARDAIAPADRLERDVARLRARAATLRIDPLEYSLRAHEVLEDALHLQLGGDASRWSGTALTALRSEVAGTRVVLRTLAPLIARRDTSGVLLQSRAALTRVDAALRRLERPDGSLPRWEALPQCGRETIDALVAGAVERLAYVPELIDPRPPRPLQRALATTPEPGDG